MPGRRRNTRIYDFEDEHDEEDSSEVPLGSYGINEDQDPLQSSGNPHGNIGGGDYDGKEVAAGYGSNVWPRRLLHVGTMTSYARFGSGKDVTYGNITNPEYNIMSYTWGRYEDPAGQTIRINNVEWPIPKIRPDVFTAAEFHRALYEAAGDLDFVWIDVACINQMDGVEKSEEVGNQAAIFARAKEAVVWLHDVRTRDIERGFDAMVRIVGDAQDSPNTPIKSSDDDTRFMTAILKSSWFSSMWTLQEAFLRKDATIMSKQGEVMEPHSLRDVVLTFNHLLKISTILYSYGSQGIQEAIDLAGLRELDASNPLVLLGTVRHRTTRRPADRIYGIMQAFGVKIGNTAPGVDSIQSFSLADLESQLAIQINYSCPTLAQLFVHLDEPRYGQAWRVKIGLMRPPDIQPSLHIPKEFFNVSQTTQEGQILFVDGRPIFKGVAWPLEKLAGLWVKEQAPQPEGVNADDEKTPDMNNFSRSFFMDQTSVFVDIAGNNQPYKSSMSKPVAIATDLVQKYPGKFLILVLGQIQDEDYEEKASVGIVVRNEARSREGLYRRIGFCTWQGTAIDPIEFRCYLG